MMRLSGRLFGKRRAGSCVAAAKWGGQIVPLVRTGYVAWTSPYEQHHMWARWVTERHSRFDGILHEGDCLVGEWLAQAHGTRYDLNGREPFVAFDIMCDGVRLPRETFHALVDSNFTVPPELWKDNASCHINVAMSLLGETGQYGAAERAEGAVWRVERRGAVDFLAKYVRRNKVDGKYLPDVSGSEVVWNWRYDADNAHTDKYESVI